MENRNYLRGWQRRLLMHEELRDRIIEMDNYAIEVAYTDVDLDPWWQYCTQIQNCHVEHDYAELRIYLNLVRNRVRDPRAKDILRRALDLIEEIQHPNGRS